MLKCRIVNKNVFSGVEWSYEIAEGSVFVENFNETLDSGTIILAHLTRKIEIEPYDEIVITNDSGNNLFIQERIMCVDTYTCTQTCLNPVYYRYEISLFSRTKQLEGALCPSLSITKLANGSRSIYYYLNLYNNLYGIKDKSGNLYQLDSRVYSRFNTIICPEMQWNEPTLREVFNDLLMIDDCIVIINSQGKIDYLDLSNIGYEITSAQKQYINYKTTRRSSADYVSGLKMKLVNSLNGTTNIVGSDKSPSISSRYITNLGFRNSEDYILTTENIRVETAFPIWKLYYVSVIFKLTLSCYAIVDGATMNFTLDFNQNTCLYSQVDNIKYILEYGEWRTRDIFYASFNNTMPLSNNYQNTCLYYKRGDNKILNFNAKQESQSFFITSQVSVLELIRKTYNSAEAHQMALQYAYNRWGEDNVTIVTESVSTISSFHDFYFHIEYESLSNDTFIAEKMGNISNKRIVVDNQTNSYVDIERQGKLEYQKANRFGNEVSIVNARYTIDEVLTPNLAQKIDDEIIFRKEMAVYNNYLNINYQTMKDYVLKDYFTGIKSKIRSWRIVEGSETFVRAELKKFYFNDVLGDYNIGGEIIPSYYTKDEYISNFKYCAIRFIDKNNVSQPNYNSVGYKNIYCDVDRYLVEFTRHRCGNSVLFTIKMPDNMFVGKYVYSVDGVGGVQQKDCRYTDDDGEFVSCEVEFYDRLNVVYSSPMTMTVLYRLLPAINHNQWFNGLTPKFRVPFTINKDNKEIFQLTIQFEENEYAESVKGE